MKKHVETNNTALHHLKRIEQDIDTALTRLIDQASFLNKIKREIQKCRITFSADHPRVPNQPKWREVKDSWFDLIESWLNKPENREIQAITGVHLLQHALNVTIDQSANLRVMETRVGIIMSRLGWPKRRQNTGKRYWQYVRPAPANSGE